MKKKILIVSIKKNELASVEQICQNLINCYSNLSSDNFEIDFFELSDLSKNAPTKEDFSTFFSNIISNPPTHLAFVQSYIIRTHFFKLLLFILDKSKTSILFHVYGDLIRQSSRFIEVEKILFGFKLCFISPSTTYTKLLESFLLEPKCISTIPFPCDDNLFKFDKQTRDEFRRHLNLSNQELVFIYTGRLTNQKNVIRLWDLLKLMKIKSEYKLVIVGPITDFENPTFGKNDLPGEYFQKIQTFLNNKNILYHPFVPPHTLASFYCASDIFISASTFHDEDFGCSPVEAAFCGLPLLLTKWGGFKDISYKLPNQSLLFPVNFKEDISEFEISVDNLNYNISLNELERNQLSILAKSFYSTKVVASQIISNLNLPLNKFNGFSEKFKNINYDKSFEISSKNYKDLYQTFWT